MIKQYLMLVGDRGVGYESKESTVGVAGFRFGAAILRAAHYTTSSTAFRCRWLRPWDLSLHGHPDDTWVSLVASPRNPPLTERCYGSGTADPLGLVVLLPTPRPIMAAISSMSSISSPFSIATAWGYDK